MKKNTLAAGTSPFAHLLANVGALARTGRLASKADDDREDPDAEEDDDTSEMEDTPADEPEKGKRGKKAKGESEDVDPDAEENEPDIGDAEDNEDDEGADEPDDDKEAKGFRKGFAAANKRARAIFASSAAAGRPDLAAQAAFDSSMSAKEAIGFIAAANLQPVSGRRSIDDRMAARRDARPGPNGTGGKATTLGQRIVAATKKARGEG